MTAELYVFSAISFWGTASEAFHPTLFQTLGENVGNYAHHEQECGQQRYLDGLSWASVDAVWADFTLEELNLSFIYRNQLMQISETEKT